MITTTLILATSVLFSIILNIILFNNNIKLKNIIDSSREDILKKEKDVNDIKNWSIKQKESLFNITPGDIGLITDYGLQYGSGDTAVNFQVTYEVEILEISVNKFKVNAINFTSYDSVGNDPSNRQGILDFINTKTPWVDKNRVDMVIDDRKRRSDKLASILGD